MSLALLQGYSSAEEEEEAAAAEPQHHDLRYDTSSDDDDDVADEAAAAAAAGAGASLTDRSPFDLPHPNAYGLPSAFDAFSELLCDIEMRGVVMEAKAQLVGIHERVRSDIEGSQPPTSAVSSTAQGGKRVVTAANPNAEDAAELLRMCLQCGVPKTYSSARGMVCPVCGDRPRADLSDEMKKKGSTIKDKEKSKRMRGQSSHATWKSETEMQLRQQFD
ncbi:hypothetical protein TIFTF001_018591 [Ficus carica]|uniref:Uncharacterized protein n=1 Tax=Ficus carica TaxID=3494 RepID=A0AA88AA13_FICCA|nr:hypothetical protein TIFTF001_018591 [Ficus carica]